MIHKLRVGVVLFFFTQEASREVAGPPTERIRTGESRSGNLPEHDPLLSDRAPSRRFDFVAEAEGPVTVSLESFDFDAFLRVETEKGEVVSETDTGGIESNARLVLDARAGEGYRIVVAVGKEGGSGEFRLTVSAGEPERSTDVVLLEAAIAYRAEAAARALARGDRKAAFRHRHEEGKKRYEQGRFAETRDAAEEAVELARELGDRKELAMALTQLGAAHRALGEHKKALEYIEEAYSLSRAIGDATRDVDTFWLLGSLHSSLGRLDEASPFLERALSLALETGDRVAESKILGEFGVLFRRRGDYPKALEYQERRLALARAMTDRAGEVKALANLGVIYSSMGENEKAREYHAAHLEAARGMGDRPAELSALNNLGLIANRLGEYAKAKAYFEETLSTARDLGDRAMEGLALNNLGLVELYQAGYEDAQRYFEACLLVFRDTGDRAMEGRSTGNLGLVCLALGDLSPAQEHFERYLSIARETGDGEAVRIATQNLGLVHEQRGELSTAREYFERSLELAREIGDRIGEAQALGNLAGVHLDLRDYRKARQLYEQELDLCRGMGDRRGEAAALGGLANVRASCGEHAQALEMHEMYLALVRALGNVEGESVALQCLGVDHELLGDLEKARAYQEESLALARRLGNRTREAGLLGNLSNVCARLGEYDRARALASQAMEAWEGLGASEMVIFPLATLARVGIAEGDYASAVESLDRVDALLRRYLTVPMDVDASRALRTRFAYWSAIAQDLTAHRVAAPNQDPNARSRLLAEGFAHAGRWKGRALFEGIAENRRGGRSPEVVQLRRERRETLAQRDRTLSRVSEAIGEGRAPVEVEALREEARGLLSKAEGISQRLREVSPRDASLELPEGVGPEEVRATALEDRTALVEYVEGENRLYAYLLTPSGFSFHDLGETKPIVEGVARYVASMANAASAAPAAEIAERGRRLFETLLAGVLAQAGEGVERLVVVPSASLATLPFEALVVRTGVEDPPRGFAGLVFVLDEYEVTYAPSSPVLVELASLGPRREGGKALVLADPLYRQEETQPREAGITAGGLLLSGPLRGLPTPDLWPRIEQTRNEAFAFVDLLVEEGDDETAAALTHLRRRRSGSVSGRRFDLHLGAEASPQRLSTDLRAYAVVHLAAHGYVDRELPRNSGIALAYLDEKKDGYLTIDDALELVLDANFVVLSACQTARGEGVQGEGVESLAWAFLHAGARGVVASLWDAEDRAAAHTMEEFYRRVLREGVAPSRALREAKLAMRRSGGTRGVAGVVSAAEAAHPFFWAPFIYIGWPR